MLPAAAVSRTGGSNSGRCGSPPVPRHSGNDAPSFRFSLAMASHSRLDPTAQARDAGAPYSPRLKTVSPVRFHPPDAVCKSVFVNCLSRDDKANSRIGPTDARRHDSRSSCCGLGWSRLVGPGADEDPTGNLLRLIGERLVRGRYRHRAMAPTLQRRTPALESGLPDASGVQSAARKTALRR